MRLCADENFPGDAVRELRTRGHDVLWILTESPNISDSEVLVRAQAEQRTVITFDKDFGELAFRLGLSAQNGILLCRLSGLPPKQLTDTLVRAIESRADWRGLFAVILNDRIRIVPLP